MQTNPWPQIKAAVHFLPSYKTEASTRVRPSPTVESSVRIGADNQCLMWNWLFELDLAACLNLNQESSLLEVEKFA